MKTYNAVVTTEDTVNTYGYTSEEFDTIEEAIKCLDQMIEEIETSTDETVIGFHITEITDKYVYSYHGDELVNVRDELAV